MADRIRRLYRVRGTWAGGFTQTRHYLTRRAAEHRRAVWLDGVVDDETGERLGYPTRAEFVTIEDSDPITWPQAADRG